MTMSEWSIAEAKARFSELVLQVRETPQRVTKRGRNVAVVIAPDEYARLVRATERADNHPMRAFLAATESMRTAGDLDIETPPRRRSKPRRSPFSDEP
jgi:prevent-host-death family protein